MRSIRLYIHHDNPQLRLLRQAIDVIQQGGVVAYPTDSGYALGCGLGEKGAHDRIKQIRQLDSRHNFTLICRDLSEVATYAKVDNSVYRLLKGFTPGPYTFILPATREVPNRLLTKRRTIGLRVPEHTVAQRLLEELAAPLMSVSLILPGEERPVTDPDDIYDGLAHQLDLLLDAGFGHDEPTTVVDLTSGYPEVLREGRGDVAPFLEG